MITYVCSRCFVVVALVDDGFADLFEKLFNAGHVVESARFDGYLAVWYFVLYVNGLLPGHLPCLNQVFLVCHHHAEEVFVLGQQLRPLRQLIVGL